MESLIRDLKYGIRMLWKNGTFSIIAILTLALGIGANSALFSVINSVLLRPLPYHEPERLVLLDNVMALIEPETLTASNGLISWRERCQSFESMAAYGRLGDGVNLTAVEQPERIFATDVTINYFDTLGIKPLAGRFFLPEDLKNNEKMAVLSFDLWHKHFTADEKVIGKKVRLNGIDFTIIGVAPDGFHYPEKTELWIPVNSKDRVFSSTTLSYAMIGRLKANASMEQARSEITALSQQLTKDEPMLREPRPPEVTLMMEEVVKNIRRTLWLLFGTVGFVLLIACANVTNLLMARASLRQREIAIRAALGATRWRLMRQLLVESLLLSLAGGVCGLLVALWGIDLLVAFGPDTLPRLNEIQLDGRVFGFTLLVSLFTGILFGLLPALQASKVDLKDSLRVDTSRMSAGFGYRSVRNLLVIAEVALALILLIGAGLLIKSFIKVQQVDLGFNPSNTLTLSLDLPTNRYPDSWKKQAFYQQLLERLQAIPGVQYVGVANNVPLGGGHTLGIPFTKQGQSPEDTGMDQFGMHFLISADYLKAAGITVSQGRDFTNQDRQGSTPVVLISQKLARRYWPNESPIGKQIQLSVEKTPREIVGVVNDVRQWGYETEIQNTLYVPYLQSRWIPETVIIRTNIDAANLLMSVRAQIQSIDKELPLYNIKTMDERLSSSTLQRRFILSLIGIFATIALSLATVGIYGIMSYSVSQRRQEIGIRRALGAQNRDIFKLILQRGLLLTGIGIVIGLIAAYSLTKLMSSLLFGISATDPLTYLMVALFFAVIALTACLLPARRATCVDPMVVLRCE